ncbi:MAG: tetratricopeptide repeat protein [Actinomycetota bacterium]|nr:tetratricopeptide repeat protein [Actinomycetota bacterium]
MAKSPSKSKAKNSRVDSDLDEYAQATAAKLDTKVIVIGVWFLIVFGLMGAFLITTNQNADTGAPSASTSTQQTAPDAAAKVKTLQDQLAKDPNNAQTIIEFGFALFDAGKYEDAAANFQRAVTLLPNNADALTGLGMAYEYMGRQNDALTQFDKAIAADPSSDFAKVRKAYLLADAQSDYDGAIKLLRKVEAKQPLGDLKVKLQNQITAYEQKRGK